MTRPNSSVSEYQLHHIVSLRFLEMVQSSFFVGYEPQTDTSLSNVTTDPTLTTDRQQALLNIIHVSVVNASCLFLRLVLEMFIFKNH